MEHETGDEKVGVQEKDFPILSVGKLGRCWLMLNCNGIYVLETSVTEEQCKKYSGGPDRAANLALPVTSYSGGKLQLCLRAEQRDDEVRLRGAWSP